MYFVENANAALLQRSLLYRADMVSTVQFPHRIQVKNSIICIYTHKWTIASFVAVSVSMWACYALYNNNDYYA